MGSGKTARLVIPNILTLARQPCSLLINDISGGELFERTSGYLLRQGFEVRVVNLMAPGRSDQFNPLSDLRNFGDTARAVSAILAGTTSHHADPFWSAGAEKILRVIVQCLRNRGNEAECTLANVKRVLGSFGEASKDGVSPFDQFVIDSTLNDPQTYWDYKSFLGGAQKTIQSFISSADTAMMALADPEIERLTARNTIDFTKLRERKIAVFVIARQQDRRLYSFVLDTLWQRAFDELLRPGREDQLPVFALLDEFGQITVPAFDVIASTARKFRLALLIVVQSIAQLEARYGTRGTQIIRDSFGTEIFLPGVGVETAAELERRLGRVKIPVGKGDGSAFREQNLRNAFEITALGTNEMLVLSGNRAPLLLDTTPYYTRRAMRAASLTPPAPLPCIEQEHVPYVHLG